MYEQFNITIWPENFFSCAGRIFPFQQPETLEIALQGPTWRDFLITNHGDLLPFSLCSVITRLDSLMIHIVEYSQEVMYLVPPLSAILSIIPGHLSEEGMHERSLQAAEALATRMEY